MAFHRRPSVRTHGPCGCGATHASGFACDAAPADGTGAYGEVAQEAVLRAAVEASGGAASLATGDGANDSPMLVAASYGVAYHAKPKARAAANGAIDRGDLTDVLRLLGIPEGEWA